MVTKTKIKQTLDVKTVDTPSDLAMVNDSQLGLFDYSQLSEPQIRKSLEIKGQMISIGKRVSNDLLDLAGLAKEQHDNLNSYALFADWCKKELGYSEPMARRFLRVGKNQQSYTTVNELPNSLNALDAIASALLKADSEEEKEEITQAINEATEEKGKALTEKEINELPEVKQLKEKLKAEQEAKKQLEESLKETKQTSLFYEQVASKKLDEINQLKETVDNQTKDIQEKNSKLSQLEAKERELKEKEEKLNKIIEVKVKEQVEEKTEEKLKKLDKQKTELEKEKAQISKELKDLESLKRIAQRQQDNLNSTQEWITNFQLTNTYLVEATHELKKYKKHLQKNPNLSELEEKDRAVVEEKIKNLIVDFNDNLHNLGGAINYLNGAVVRFNNYALRVLDVEGEVTEND